MVDGVFEAAGDGGVGFHEARVAGPEALAEIQAEARSRLLRALTRRGLLEREEAPAMAAWEHGGGFSPDAGVRIEAENRPGLERSLRYCARPALALERWREIDAEDLVYEAAAPASSPLLRRTGAQCTATLGCHRHGGARRQNANPPLTSISASPGRRLGKMRRSGRR